MGRPVYVSELLTCHNPSASLPEPPDWGAAPVSRTAAACEEQLVDLANDLLRA